MSGERYDGPIESGMVFTAPDNDGQVFRRDLVLGHHPFKPDLLIYEALSCRMRARLGSGVGEVNVIPEANLRIVMQPEPKKRYAIMLTPEATRGYGPPEGVGPFDDRDEALAHLGNIELEPGWLAQVVDLDEPTVARREPQQGARTYGPQATVIHHPEGPSRGHSGSNLVALSFACNRGDHAGCEHHRPGKPHDCQCTCHARRGDSDG